MLALSVNLHSQEPVALIVGNMQISGMLRVFFILTRVYDCLFISELKFEANTKDTFGVIYSTKYTLSDNS